MNEVLTYFCCQLGTISIHRAIKYNCINPYIIYLQILTDAALLKRQRKEIEELRAKLRVWFSGNSHHMKWVQHPIMKFKVCLSIKSIQLEDTNLHSFLSLELSKWSLGGRNSEFAEHATAGCFLSISFFFLFSDSWLYNTSSNLVIIFLEWTGKRKDCIRVGGGKES